MINGHFVSGRRRLPRPRPRRGTLQLAFIALLLPLLAAFSPSEHAFAQTPHSVTRTCGYTGGPTCPAAMLVTGPWLYSIQPLPASERYAACYRGKPLPPLNTWNNRVAQPFVPPNPPLEPDVPPSTSPPPIPWWIGVLPFLPWPGNPIYGGL